VSGELPMVSCDKGGSFFWHMNKVEPENESNFLLQFVSSNRQNRTFDLANF